ncbi:hypothetical protein MCC10129_0117 [Bifidobacterium longum subsp. longum]|nr:hypothetical protein MCC10129_0117 [Bifidobacterium longum subsp. longum]
MTQASCFAGPNPAPSASRRRHRAQPAYAAPEKPPQTDASPAVLPSSSRRRAPSADPYKRSTGGMRGQSAVQQWLSPPARARAVAAHAGRLLHLPSAHRLRAQGTASIQLRRGRDHRPGARRHAHARQQRARAPMVQRHQRHAQPGMGARARRPAHRPGQGPTAHRANPIRADPLLGLVRGWGVDPTRPRRGDHGQSAVFPPGFFPHSNGGRLGVQNVENPSLEERVEVP